MLPLTGEGVAGAVRGTLMRPHQTGGVLSLTGVGVTPSPPDGPSRGLSGPLSACAEPVVFGASHTAT